MPSSPPPAAAPPPATDPRPVGLPAGLPVPGERRVSVRVTRDAQRQIRGGHPWVFDASITGISHEGARGDLAVVFDDKRRFLAIGLYDPDSPIRVRILHRGAPRTVDDTFWREQLTAALDRRAALARSDDTNAYRCVHGENDGLPGLVVDRYDRTLVVKLDSPAWLAHLGAVVPALADVVRPTPERVVLRLSRSVRTAAGRLGLPDGTVLAGMAVTGPVPFRENGLRFEADVVRGQKTGHFLDQRENRARVGARSGGARVLDVFCCNGGFTVHAAAGGASLVHSVDASAHAVAAVARHLELNADRPEVARCRATSTVGDAFDILAALGADGRRFDVVVVDPPSFAAKRADVAGALGAYRRLTRLALAVVAPGGTLVQSSCSSRVAADAFVAAVQGAALDAGRPLQDLELTGHGADHPVGFAQGAYLKTVFARVP